MHLVQILLPLRDDKGRGFPKQHYDKVASVLTNRVWRCHSVHENTRRRPLERSSYLEAVTVLDDRYSDFDELSRNEREGVDFKICLTRRESPVAIIAPHGGKIESGTSEIAAAIAGEMYCLYCFEGLKSGGNRTLHVPSTKFDEPKCMELISTCDIVVSVHGLKGKHEAIDVGGLDNELRDAICRSLNNAGFAAKIVTSGSHAGVSQRNICNRGRPRAGVQLEITKGLRGTMLARSQSLIDFGTAVRWAIDRLRRIRL